MPRYGFNFLWLFNSDSPERLRPEPDLRALDFIREHGFNFVRLPTDYRLWTQGADYFNPDEKVFEQIDAVLEACNDRGMQLSLNLHRAPGYCINRNEIEKHDLWTDTEAQDAFAFLWETFAARYRAKGPDQLSFDLVNEPPAEGWSMAPKFTRARHEAVMRRTVGAIRAVDPEREIVIDGLGGGNIAMPELADLQVVQSCRGYAPFKLTHYKASWAKDSDTWPEPTWPMPEGEKNRDREALIEFYKPWRDLEDSGTRVHVGEFGCYNQTPNAVALAWFRDLLGLFQEFGWGYAMWNFEGAFGVIQHGRPGAVFEAIDGYTIDRELWELYCAARVG